VTPGRPDPVADAAADRGLRARLGATSQWLVLRESRERSTSDPVELCLPGDPSTV
jgi:hypothetical protein